MDASWNLTGQDCEACNTKATAEYRVWCGLWLCEKCNDDRMDGEDSARGTTTTARRPCPTCSGEGELERTGVHTGSRGCVQGMESPDTWTEDCPDCDGTGFADDEDEP